MRNKKSVSCALWIALISTAGTAVAAAPSGAERDEIKKNWEECQKLEKDKTTPPIIFINKSDDESAAKWKLVKSFKEDQEFSGSHELFFDSSKRLRLGIEHMGSQSGDHSYDVHYCFRQNGTIAFVMRNFLTSQGDIREEKRIWISENQKKLGDEIKTFDLESEKETKDANYFQPDRRGWKTIPAAIEKYTAAKHLGRFPKKDLP